MTPEAQAAYEKALESIEKCRLGGELGMILDLRGLGLTQVPPEIGQLSALTELHLHNNQLTSLPTEIGQLSALTELHLDSNKLTSLPPEIGRLSALTHISIHRNKLAHLPKEILQLSSVTILGLSFNQLTSLPPGIGQLIALEQFLLGDNQLTRLPPEIGQLSLLRRLFIRNNQLTSLPSEIGELRCLEELILEGNVLVSLPESLKRLPKLDRLMVHGNAALRLPVELLGPTYAESNDKNPPAKPQAILDYYFRSLIAGGPLNEVKVILVGRGGAGKTSLVKRLVRDEFDANEKETPGISITDWSLQCGNDSVKLHLWDFAGQEITHGTHQFFFSQRSVYLLLLTGREGNAERDADYWLRLIRAFGADSPVLVVQNKIEQSPFELDEPAIQRDHPNVQSFHPVDCQSGTGRAGLLKALKKTIHGMESVHKTFPAEWMKVKDRLSGMKENYLDQKQYRTICAVNGEKDNEAQDALAGHLHHLGIALNYADDPRVRHALVLNPGWVTDGIYKLIRGVENSKPPGELKASALAKLLPEEKQPKMRRYLVDLMRKFELCFALDEEEKRFLVPAVLPVKSPVLDAAWMTDKEALRLRYEYDALPQGLLPRFLVRTHVLSQDKRRWRSGVMLAFEGAEALVRAVQGKLDYIEIIIRGEHEPVQRLAAVVRENFRVIHDDIKALAPRLMIEVAGGTGVYQRLGFLEDEAKKDGPLRVDGGKEVLVVDEMKVLDKVQPPEVLDSPKPVLRVFVSYSHKDHALKEQFDVNLKVLANQKKIIPWSDSRLAGGEDWNQEIENALKAADIILFLVSSSFLASDYVRDNEMPLAMKRAEAKEAVVVPVILKDCGWQEEEWQKYNALPVPLTPVADSGDVEKAFFAVEKGLREVIKRMLADPKRKQRRLHEGDGVE
jgi:internalin A